MVRAGERQSFQTGFMSGRASDEGVLLPRSTRRLCVLQPVHLGELLGVCAGKKTSSWIISFECGAHCWQSLDAAPTRGGARQWPTAVIPVPRRPS